MSAAKMMICRESFWTVVDGRQELIREGRTLASDDSDIYLRYPDKFIQAEASYRSDAEQATAAPGERRAVKI